MQPPSEFNLQLNKIREREDEVKRAIETSEMILSQQIPSSSRRLEKVSTKSIRGGTTIDATSNQELSQQNSKSAKQMPNILTGTFSSAPAMDIQITDSNMNSQT